MRRVGLMNRNAWYPTKPGRIKEFTGQKEKNKE
jgi:hypothetical protein